MVATLSRALPDLSLRATLPGLGQDPTVPPGVLLLSLPVLQKPPDGPVICGEGLKVKGTCGETGEEGARPAGPVSGSQGSEGD